MWTSETGQRLKEHKWSVPASLRGKYARVEVSAFSPQVEPFTLRMKFKKGADEVAEYLLKPYLHREHGKDFFVFAVPAEADTCDVTLKFSEKAKQVTITDLRAFVTSP